MPDRLDAMTRRALMQKVRSKSTGIELQVRKLLHAEGFRFRLHRKDLPGTPDIVLPRYRTVIFVHGCFWHSHSCAKGSRPKTNSEFWDEKLDGNIRRDRSKVTALDELGWRVIVVWECELRHRNELLCRLKKQLSVPSGKFETHGIVA